MSRAGLYLRVSTLDQHPENQLADLSRRLEFERWTELDRYVDHGVSGARASRPELDRLLSDCRAGRLDVVVCWSVSRFGRNMVHSVVAMHELISCGVRLVFCREGIDTSSPIGRGVAAMLAALAEQELEEKRARVREGMARVLATRVGGRPGTERTRTGRAIGRPRVAVDPRVALQLVSDGLSLDAAAARLGVSRRTLSRALTVGQKPLFD